ncbi:MAG: porin family protein [Gammaproteobacteria bacterium]|nr:porin family protein [Gammaproteobacteria bacterium]
MIAVLAVALPVIAAEEDKLKDAYIGADVSFIGLDVEGVTYSPVATRIRLGIDLLTDVKPKVSIESHFGFNITEETNTIQVSGTATDATLTLNYYLGLYARASMDVSDTITAYGLLGFTSAQISGDTLLLSNGDTESGLSLGVGGLVQLPFGIDGFVEVMQLVNGDNFDALAISVGILRKL